MTGYRLRGETNFTKAGRLGVWLFLGGYVAFVVGAGWLYHRVDFMGGFGNQFAPLVLPALVVLVSSFAFLVGAVLMLIGRETTFDAFPADAAFGGQRERWRP